MCQRKCCCCCCTGCCTGNWQQNQPTDVWQQNRPTSAACCQYINNRTGRTQALCFPGRESCPPRGGYTFFSMFFVGDCSTCRASF